MTTYAVCLNHPNIADEKRVKRTRGEIFEASPEWVEAVLKGDEEAGRLPRVVLIDPDKLRKPRARPRKAQADD